MAPRGRRGPGPGPGPLLPPLLLLLLPLAGGAGGEGRAALEVLEPRSGAVYASAPVAVRVSGGWRHWGVPLAALCVVLDGQELCHADLRGEGLVLPTIGLGTHVVLASAKLPNGTALTSDLETFRVGRGHPHQAALRSPALRPLRLGSVPALRDPSPEVFDRLVARNGFPAVLLPPGGEGAGGAMELGRLETWQLLAGEWKTDVISMDGRTSRAALGDYIAEYLLGPPSAQKKHVIANQELDAAALARLGVAAPVALLGGGGTACQTPLGMRLWASPEGHLTPLHFDATDQVVVQYAGSERYVLVPPEEVDYAFYHDLDPIWWSATDVRAQLALAEDPSRLGVVLEAGQMLFVPAGWAHVAVSRGSSISVAFAQRPGCRPAVLDAQGATVDPRHRLEVFRHGGGCVLYHTEDLAAAAQSHCSAKAALALNRTAPRVLQAQRLRHSVDQIAAVVERVDATALWYVDVGLKNGSNARIHFEDNVRGTSHAARFLDAVDQGYKAEEIAAFLPEVRATEWRLRAAGTIPAQPQIFRVEPAAWFHEDA